MTKEQIKAMMRQAISPHLICRVFMKYHAAYWYYFPLIVGEKLFLGAEENDFILDGYSIRRFRDVVKTEIKSDKCLQILTAEGILEQLTVPEVDITDWKSVFISLQKMGENVIVEGESINKEECEFSIGRITRVLSDAVLLRHFDADGVWQEETLKIPFSQITSVTFGSRYVEVFSKYLPPIS